MSISLQNVYASGVEDMAMYIMIGFHKVLFSTYSREKAKFCWHIDVALSSERYIKWFKSLWVGKDKKKYIVLQYPGLPYWDPVWCTVVVKDTGLKAKETVSSNPTLSTKPLGDFGPDSLSKF